MDARTQERDLIERDLPGAIIKGDVRPYYQPLIDLQTKHVAGFEALAAGSIRHSARFRPNVSSRSRKAVA